MEYNLIKILADKKLLDSYQFIESSQFKLFSAKVSIYSLNATLKEQFEKFDEYRDGIIEEALESGEASIKYKPDVISYLGIDIERTVVIDKLCIEIFSILHSFFDNFAQCINSSLYANEGEQNIKKVTFSNTVKILDNFPEYLGDFIDNLRDIQNTEEYKFISDFNNVVKHRHQIFVKGKFNFFNGEKSILTPKFHKDEKFYDEKEAIKIINNCYNICSGIFDEYIAFLEKHFATNSNKYTANRIYNPKTELIFQTKEDYQKRGKPINSIHYIELDEANLIPTYKILLIKSNDDMERFEMYNSVYDFIAVRETTTHEYIAYLIPKDNEIYEMNDGRLIKYREYKLIKDNYIIEIAKKATDGKISYFPLLSDGRIIILNTLVE